MRKLTSLLAAALTFAACAPEEDAAVAYRDALPKAEAIQLGTPQAEGTEGALSVRTSALGDSPALQSEYAVMSYYLALTMNTGVGWTLGFLHFVTRFPPTSCDDRSCTWGPWIDDAGLNRWKLNVEKVGGAFEYALSAQKGSTPEAPFVDFITGTAQPAAKDRGTGTFTIDFEAEAALDHGALWEQKDFGQIAVSYDNTSDLWIAADFVNARNDDPAKPHAMNAAYEFREYAGAETKGELQIAFQDRETNEVVSLRTRWSPSGAGRADAHYVGAGADPVEFDASECWDGEVQEFVEVYDSKHPEITELSDPSACSPFSSALPPDIELP